MKAIVLCGGLPQIELINNLKKRNIETILLDMNDKVVARPFADKFYPVSVLDYEEVKKVAIKENIDLVLTVCADQVLLIAAKLSEELGLSTYIDYKTAVAVSNKQEMKKVFKKNDISTSDFVVLNEFSIDKLKELYFPLIVKPVDSYSSRGVKKVYDFDSLKTAFGESYSISRCKNVIVEEYVEGIELSIDLYVKNGLANILCISKLDKIPNNDKFVINRCCFPAQINEDIKNKIQKCCQNIVNAFELKDCPMLVQAIVNAKGVYVLEFCARTGGGNKFRLIKHATGFDVVNAVVELTLGQEVVLPEEQNKENIFILDEFIYSKSGVLNHLEGFDESKNNGIIKEYYQLKNEGSLLKEPSSSGDRVAYFTIQASSYEELLNKYKIAIKNIKIIGQDGQDLARHDLMDFKKDCL